MQTGESINEFGVIFFKLLNTEKKTNASGFN